ncbi:GNAT family N-acetyltransferase [Exiguobacterium sp. SH3S2]|uniref:GNAT family N-acetyltransferase n=1 Tax=unclassified Exiguobacterium TaxID=2644629 RepID=UPI0010395B3E|nr:MULTISPECIES: GNAT family N-acetyltransferase [unclassified Exiguobacterium]TCI48756.1 GNAT family N-acetyltransferase [Exiguobacterium sp. SH3S3]TCI63621.1 GNAT family N-acetyltransferase [Exiguobacterium sp. SH3S2]
MLQQVLLEEVIPLRHLVLRPGLPVETCYFDGDDAETTCHYAWAENGHILSIATVIRQDRELSGERVSFQLRGMATDPDVAGTGVGSRFLQAVHRELNASWWCNAREVAVRFYERNGLVIIGDPFEIEGIGTHYVMLYKKTAGS